MILNVLINVYQPLKSNRLTIEPVLLKHNCYDQCCSIGKNKINAGEIEGQGDQGRLIVL